MTVLHKVELKPGYTEAFRGGKGHDDVFQLLRDLHLGVLELGVGKCTVLAHDHLQSQPMAFGFDLCREGDPETVAWWEFFIRVHDWRETSHRLPPRTRGVIATTPGRARLARMFEVGLSPETIEERLADS